MWSVARYDLGLTDDEFYGLTPRQYDALLKRKEYQTWQQEFLFAQLTAFSVNFSLCHPMEPVCIGDFMPSEFAKKKSEPSKTTKSGRVRITKAVKRDVTYKLRVIMNAFRQRPPRN